MGVDAFSGSELVNLSAPFLEDSVVSRLQEFLGLYSLEKNNNPKKC